MPQDALPYSLPIGTTREWHGNLLTLTEEGWRCEVKHSMHRRCKGWDYCNPWIYMVTIDTQHHDVPPMPQIAGYRLPEWLERIYARGGHPHLFGELADALDDEGRAIIRLNAFGRAVDECIMDIPKYHPEVSIIERVVMPNHVHFILRVVRRLPEGKAVGHIINMWKSRVNALYKLLMLGVPKETYMNVGAMVDGSLEPEAPSTRLQQGRARYGGNGPKHPKRGLVFEPGFHDRILFREGQLQTMIEYVRSNPQRLWEVVHNRQWFEKVAGWKITMPLLPDGGTKHAGRWWQYYPGGTQALISEGGARGLLAPVEIGKGASSMEAKPSMKPEPNIEPKAIMGAEPNSKGLDTITMNFNAIGNRALLRVPERMQIQCSRSMSEEAICELIDDVLEACSHGVVIVSPCISDGEKRVARAVMDAGYQLIVLFPKGIPPQTDEYKPYGVFFDACARGQLLILSPWEFKAGVETLTRWQCLMLNDIAAQLSM